MISILPKDISSIYLRGDFVKYKEFDKILHISLHQLKNKESINFGSIKLDVIHKNNKFVQIIKKVTHILKKCFSSQYRQEFNETVKHINKFFQKIQQIKINIQSGIKSLKPIADKNLKNEFDLINEELNSLTSDKETYLRMIKSLTENLEKYTQEKRELEAQKNELLRRSTSFIHESELIFVKEIVEENLLNENLLAKNIFLSEQVISQIELIKIILIPQLERKIASLNFEKNKLFKVQKLENNINKLIEEHTSLLNSIGFNAEFNKLTNFKNITLNNYSISINERKCKIRMLIYQTLGTGELTKLSKEDIVKKLIDNKLLSREINYKIDDSDNFPIFEEVLKEIFKDRYLEIAIHYLLCFNKSPFNEFRKHIFEVLHEKTENDLSPFNDSQSLNLTETLNYCFLKGVELKLNKPIITQTIIKELNGVLSKFKIKTPEKKAISVVREFIQNCKTNQKISYHNQLLLFEACTYFDTNSKNIATIAALLFKAMNINYFELLARAKNQKTDLINVLIKMVEESEYAHPTLSNDIIAAEILEIILKMQTNLDINIELILNQSRKLISLDEWHKKLIEFFNAKPHLMKTTLEKLKAQTVDPTIKRKIEDSLKERFTTYNFVERLKKLLLCTHQINKKLAHKYLLETFEFGCKKLKNLSDKLSTEKTNLELKLQYLEAAFKNMVLPKNNNIIGVNCTNDWEKWYFSHLRRLFNKRKEKISKDENYESIVISQIKLLSQRKIEILQRRIQSTLIIDQESDKEVEFKRIYEKYGLVKKSLLSKKELNASFGHSTNIFKIEEKYINKILNLVNKIENAKPENIDNRVDILLFADRLKGQINAKQWILELCTMDRSEVLSLKETLSSLEDKDKLNIINYLLDETQTIKLTSNEFEWLNSIIN